MAQTAFQTQALALQVGVPITPINLAAYCPLGTTFGIVGSSRVYPAAGLLPPGLTMSSAGVISGTPTTAGVTVCRARAYRGTRDPDGSWNARRAGAYNSERFDTDIVTERQNARSAYDTAVKRSGVASLRQFKNAGDSHQAGAYAGWFWPTRAPQPAIPNPNTGIRNVFASNAGFAAGEEFWVQFSVRPDDNYCRVNWPPDPKIAILDMLPWATNLNLGPTANDWEIVTTQRAGGIFGYYNSPQGPGWTNFGSIAGGDINYTPAFTQLSRTLNGDNPGLSSGAGPNWTAAQQLRAKYGPLYSYHSTGGAPDGRPDPLTPTGPGWAVNQWHTILLHVKNGSGAVSASADVGSMIAWGTAGQLDVYIAHEGQDYVQVFSRAIRPHVSRTSSPYYDRSGTQTNGQDTTWSGLYFTNLVYDNPLTGLPATNMWIDELICSPTAIPAPDFDGTGTYRTADVLLTFKVS